MQIQEGQLVLNSRETLFKVNEIKNNLAYCEICSTADHRRVLNLPEIRPYFLQLHQHIRLITGIDSFGRNVLEPFVVTAIFYWNGGLIIRVEDSDGIETEFSEKEILEKIVL